MRIIFRRIATKARDSHYDPCPLEGHAFLVYRRWVACRNARDDKLPFGEFAHVTAKPPGCWIGDVS